jgi:hypothetical protein
MILVAGGDSFVYGSELKDCLDAIDRNDEKNNRYGYSVNTFPALLTQDLEYVCVAWPGYSNESIARTVIAECSQHNKCGVIVSWTFPGRYEFRFNYDTKQKKSPWFSFNSWTIQKPENIFENFKKTHAGIQGIFEEHYNNSLLTGTNYFAKVFFEHVGNSEYWEVYSSIKEILYLQNYLKNKKIPYLFTCADNQIFYNFTIQNPDKYISSIYEQIDFNNWFWFPQGHKANETKEPRGFYQWALENKYPVGTTHPLEEAHLAAAELIKEKFNELVTKPLEQN